MKPVTAEQLYPDSVFHVAEGAKVKIGRGCHGDVMEVCCSDGSKVILETRFADSYLVPPGSDDYAKPSEMEACEILDQAFLWLSLRAGSSGTHSVREVRAEANSVFLRQDGWFLPPSMQESR